MTAKTILVALALGSIAGVAAGPLAFLWVILAFVIWRL